MIIFSSNKWRFAIKRITNSKFQDTKPIKHIYIFNSRNALNSPGKFKLKLSAIFIDGRLRLFCLLFLKWELEFFSLLLSNCLLILFIVYHLPSHSSVLIPQFFWKICQPHLSPASFVSFHLKSEWENANSHKIHRYINTIQPPHILLSAPVSWFLLNLKYHLLLCVYFVS